MSSEIDSIIRVRKYRKLCRLSGSLDKITIDIYFNDSDEALLVMNYDYYKHRWTVMPRKYAVELDFSTQETFEQLLVFYFNAKLKIDITYKKFKAMLDALSSEHTE